MSKSKIPFEALPGYIKWLEKEVEKSEGYPAHREFEILLKKARGRLRHLRRYSKRQ
jgi:hypothetical protein